MKAWERFKDFVLFKLQRTKFGTDLLQIIKKKEIKTQIEDLNDIIKQNKTWSRLDDLIEADQAAKNNAKEVRNPSINTNEQKGPSTWFSSETFQKHLQKFKDSWKKAMSSKSKVPKEIIPDNEFTDMAHFARFNAMLSDKNRNNSFDFTNKQYICGNKLWYPEDYSFDNDQLPPDWDVHKKLDREHDCLQIYKSGNDAGAKMGSVLTLGGIVKDLCSMYRDVSLKIHPDQSNERKFFVNFKQEELAPLINTRGSLLAIYSRVIGVEHATVNSIRRSLEGFIRDNSDKIDLKRIKTVQSHSDSVGLAYYDRGAGDYRSGIVHKLSKVEGSYSKPEEVPEDVAELRAKREEEDKKVRESASTPTKKAVNLSKSAKVAPEDRLFMQNLLTADKYRNLHPIASDSQFPGKINIHFLHTQYYIIFLTGNKPFKKIFYRLVDSESLQEDDKVRLRAIEERLFIETKSESCKDFAGQWTGSLMQNKKADLIIATKIRSAFRIHEKRTSKDARDKFFYFKGT